MPFDYSLDFKTIDFRSSELYRVGRVSRECFWWNHTNLKFCPYWRKTRILLNSLAKNLRDVSYYLQQDDFIGADMARNFTQMGYTADTLIIKRQKI